MWFGFSSEEWAYLRFINRKIHLKLLFLLLIVHYIFSFFFLHNIIHGNIPEVSNLLAILLRARWICDGIAMRSPFPSVSRGMIASMALGREKWDFLCFPNFIWTNLKCGRTYFSSGKDLNGSAVILVHEARRAVDEIVRAAIIIWVF